MDIKKNLVKLVEDLQAENDMLKKHIESLNEELYLFQNKFGDDWIRAKEYVEAIQRANEAKRGYEKAMREITLIKADYKKKLEEMMSEYKFKE